jgi:hypothetical protein
MIFNFRLDCTITVNTEALILIVNSRNFRLTQYIFYFNGSFVLPEHDMFRPDGHHQVLIHFSCMPIHVVHLTHWPVLQIAVKSKIHNICM